MARIDRACSHRGLVVTRFERAVALGPRRVHLGQRHRHGEVVVECGAELLRPLAGHHGADAAAHPVQELLDARVRLHGVLQRGLGELQHRPVVRAAQVVAQFRGPDPAEHRGDRQHVAKRLAHLLAAHGDPAVVQPVPGEAVAHGLGLGDLVLVVREDQVHAARVDVELRAQVGLAHRDAFGVPAGAPRPPRRRPRRLAGLGALPQREVTRIALTRRDALALVHVVDPVAGQLAVVGVAQNVEVDVAPAGVGVPVVDQPLDQLDHLGDVPGGTGLGRRGQHAKRVVRLGEGPLEGGCPLPPRPARVGGLVEDLVVDVGDVADECHVVALGGQPAPQHVERDTAAYVADVG